MAGWIDKTWGVLLLKGRKEIDFEETDSVSSLSWTVWD